MEGLKDLTREAIAAGFLNIDIDSSHAGRPVAAERRRSSSGSTRQNTAELTRLIRDHPAAPG